MIGMPSIDSSVLQRMEQNAAENRAKNEANIRAAAQNTSIIKDPHTGQWTTQADYDKKVATLNAQGFEADGVTPRRPEWNTMLDPNGDLQSRYLLQAQPDVTMDQRGVDAIRSRALATGPSAWAQMATSKQGLEQLAAMDQARQQSLGAQAQAMSQMAMRGGLGGGSRERMARGSMRDQLMAAQGVNRQGQLDRYNIGLQDEQNKYAAQKDLVNADWQNAQLGLQNRSYATDVNKFNIQNTMGETDARRQADLNTYNTRMQTWAANRSADAQAKAAGGGGGGCCFIFLEARYGTGAMDAVVRKYRDEHMTDRNRRGYYKLSEVLVPMMRKSRLVKGLVRITMTDPLVSYGKWHYTKKGLGFLFAPVKNFWLKTFDYLGQDHEFIRENGEVI